MCEAILASYGIIFSLFFFPGTASSLTKLYGNNYVEGNPV